MTDDASPENLRKFLESDALGAERGQGSVRWNHLWSIDGLDMDGHDIIRELKREYQDKHQVGIYRSPYY